MIISCKNCLTKYFVKDNLIPKKGRIVKCSTCSNQWLATNIKKKEIQKKETYFNFYLHKLNIPKLTNLNKLTSLIVTFLIIFTFPIKTDEFDITASVVNIDKANEILDAEGSVVVIDQDNNKITSEKGKYFKKDEILEAEGSVVAIDADKNKIIADRGKYFKKKELYEAEGSVVITDTEDNKMTTDRIEHYKNENKIIGYENSKVYLNKGYIVSSDSLIYDTIKKEVKSNEYSTLIDLDGNKLDVDMFEYSFIKKIFASIGDIKLLDSIDNKHYFDELFIDTENKKMIGSNVRVDLNRENVNETYSKENEPRFVANSSILTKTKSFFTKGIYTICKMREDGKCPPWKIQASKITHDKQKKTIYYDNAVIKVYDIPVFWTPKFFHPDPTVKRQSGFLTPAASDSEQLGAGVDIPYFWAISDNKDLTFTPKIYVEEHPVFMSEYRQVNEYSDIIIDTSYTAGYKVPSNKQTSGSRNHIFLKSNLDLNLDSFDKSTAHLNIQRTSNDTYFRVHEIDTHPKVGGTGLVKSKDTSLENEIRLNLDKDDMIFSIKGNAYENLTDPSNSRYEFIGPDINFRNNLYSSDDMGIIGFDARAYYKNYSVNKETHMSINNVTWTSNQDIDNKGILTSMQGLVKNVNYDADNTEFKNDGAQHELSGVVAMTKSLPLQKNSEKYLNTLTPKIMFRYAPGHMRDLSDDGGSLNTTSIFSLNNGGTADVIPTGESAVLGIDFSINEKKKISALQFDEEVDTSNIENDEEEIYINSALYKKFSLSVGEVFRPRYNYDISSKSSLDKKMSDFVGDMTYYFSPNKNINYKFNMEKGFQTFNSHDISGRFDLGKVAFNIDYLENNNHLGQTHYVKSDLTLDINDTNSLNFATRRNFEIDGTEYININYQYLNDCLRARLEFKRNFYSDRDLEPTDNLRFTLAILPFYQYATGNLSNARKNLDRLLD